MSVEGNVWNQNNKAWRRLIDSPSIAWDFSVNEEATANLVDNSIGVAKLTVTTTDRLIGRDTAGAGAAEEIALSTGLEFTGSQSIRLANTAVTPGSYTGADFTVDAQGRITAAASGTPAAFVRLVTATVSTSTSTLDLVLTSYAAYKTLLIVLQAVRPGTDDVQLYMRFSTDGGANYDAGASNYIYGVHAANQAEGEPTDGSTGATQISITSNDANAKLSSDAGASANFYVYLNNWQSTTLKTQAYWHGSQVTTVPGQIAVYGSGHRTTAQDTDAVRFLPSTGNFESYVYTIYGLT